MSFKGDKPKDPSVSDLKRKLASLRRRIAKLHRKDKLIQQITDLQAELRR